MNALQSLAAQAIVGTERQSAPLPAIDGAVGELLAQLTATEQDPATALLRAAGVLAVCGRAGHTPPQGAARAPSPSDTRPPADEEALAQTLGHILSGGPDRLRAEALGRLEANGRVLPHRLLPAALELGKRTAILRPLIQAALGERGHWVAAHNAQWGYVTAPDDAPPSAEEWDTASAAQREAMLRKHRKTDPAGARERLAGGFADVGARERAALLAVLEEELGEDDEAFLDAALGDRSKEVRQGAARLLALVPGSGYVRRMGERLDACLREERKLFRATLVIDAPEHFLPEWKNDNLEEAKPQDDKLGQRAWWLLQLARAVPLSWWQQRTGMAPGALLEWAAKTDWRDALLRAWSEALDRQADTAWADALLERPSQPGFAQNRWALIAMLPPARREQHWRQLLASRGGNDRTGSMLDAMFNSLPMDAHALSNDFCRDILQQVRTRIQTTEAGRDYALRTALPEFACLLPEASLDAARRDWPAATAENDYLTEALARFYAIIEQRSILHRHLPIKRVQP